LRFYSKQFFYHIFIMKSFIFRAINAFFLMILIGYSFETKAGLVGGNYPKIKVGPRIGINFSQLTDNENYNSIAFNQFYNPVYNFTFNSQNNTGLSIGFQTEIKLDEYFSTIIEINYNQAGSLLSGTLKDTTGTYVTQLQRKINYIQIPVLGKFSLGNDKYNFNLFGGPALNLAIVGNENFNIEGTTQYNENISINEFGGINQYDVSLIIGIGFSVKFENLELNYDLRYNRGFIDTNYTKVNGRPAVYNSIISLSTSIAFEL
jgi:hypothetical protein